MQKVEGSSPFSRFGKARKCGPFIVERSDVAGVSRNRVPNAARLWEPHRRVERRTLAARLRSRQSGGGVDGLATRRFAVDETMPAHGEDRLRRPTYDGRIARLASPRLGCGQDCCG